MAALVLLRESALRKLGTFFEAQNRYHARNSERAIEIFQKRLASACSGDPDFLRTIDEPIQESREIAGIARFDMPAAGKAFNDPSGGSAAGTYI